MNCPNSKKSVHLYLYFSASVRYDFPQVDKRKLVLHSAVQIPPPAPGQAGRHFQSPKVHLCGRVSRAAESECHPLLSLRCHSYPPPPPPTAPDDAPKVVFTHSRLHMAARLENTFERDFLFQKNGRCGMGWDSVSSLQSSIETEDGSVYTKLR